MTVEMNSDAEILLPWWLQILRKFKQLVKISKYSPVFFN